MFRQISNLSIIRSRYSKNHEARNLGTVIAIFNGRRFQHEKEESSFGPLL